MWRTKKVVCGDCKKEFTTSKGLFKHQRTTCKAIEKVG